MGHPEGGMAGPAERVEKSRSRVNECKRLFTEATGNNLRQNAKKNRPEIGRLEVVTFVSEELSRPDRSSFETAEGPALLHGAANIFWNNDVRSGSVVRGFSGLTINGRQQKGMGVSGADLQGRADDLPPIINPTVRL